MHPPVDLLIADATVLPMDGGRQPASHASIAVSDGRILEVGPAGSMASRYAARRTIDDADDGIAQGCLDAGVRAILGRAAMDIGPAPEPFLESAAVAVDATERFMGRWNGKGNRLLVRPEAMSEVTASQNLILSMRLLPPAEA